MKLNNPKYCFILFYFICETRVWESWSFVSFYWNLQFLFPHTLKKPQRRRSWDSAITWHTGVRKHGSWAQRRLRRQERKAARASALGSLRPLLTAHGLRSGPFISSGSCPRDEAMDKVSVLIVTVCLLAVCTPGSRSFRLRRVTKAQVRRALESSSYGRWCADMILDSGLILLLLLTREGKISNVASIKKDK